jgi:hypothetical protein
MASATVSLSYHGTLVATVADAITFDNKAVKTVEVKNRASSGDVYFRVDGTTAVAAANNTYYVGPGESVIVPMQTASGASDLVSIVSTGTPAYSVTAVS